MIERAIGKKAFALSSVASLLVSGCSGDDDELARPVATGVDAGGKVSADSGWIGSGGTTKDGGFAEASAAGSGGVSGASGGASGSTASGGAPACLDATKPCQSKDECCGDLSCDTTTLGQVCCGEIGAACATANGEDCCRDLLCESGKCVAPDTPPTFQAPFPCGQSWTYSHHSGEVRRALDFINNSGNTNNSPVLAAAAGTATRHYEAGGAGNYIVVTHGGGWKTYYFHLQAFSVADGSTVSQGQEVGRVGSTGASTGPHLHFEELLDGVGKDIVLDGKALAPYPSSYYQKSVTSNNCP
jgi:hypothetical protein